MLTGKHWQDREQALRIYPNNFLTFLLGISAAHCVSGQITQKGWQPISVRLNENNLQTSPDSDVSSSKCEK